VILCGQELRDLDKRGLAAAYRKVQMVFQDPNSSLNPRMSVRRIIGEPLKLHLKMTAAERDERVRELLQLVQLDEALIDRLPHQLSGGQRQRVGIARALAVHPEVVILDEPTSSLDVSVRGQIVALLEDLQARLGLAYVFISHDLNVVNHLAHDIAVMYLGEVIEMGSTADVFENPVHPYTKALLASAPRPKWAPVSGDSVRLDGEIPSPVDLPPGCRLEGRCPVAESTCAIERPHLEGVDRNHLVACPVMIRASTRTVAESPMVSST